jgi:hypothetical protein
VGFRFWAVRSPLVLFFCLMAAVGMSKTTTPDSISFGHEVCCLKDGNAVPDTYAGGNEAISYASDAGNLRHWDKRTVSVYIDPNSTEMRRRDVVPFLTTGMAMWSRRMNNTVHLVLTSNPDSADISVSFVSPGSLAGKAIGRTDVTFRMGDQVLVHANVSINENLATEQLVQVAAHEMGHALGIQGHSPSRADLMYPYAHLPARITLRDQNTMNVSYGLPCCKTADADTASDLPVESSSSALTAVAP